MKGIEFLLAMPVAALAIFLAACASTSPTPGVRAELAPTGTLRVAVFTGNPVLGTRDKATGEVSGTTVTMGRALAALDFAPPHIVVDLTYLVAPGSTIRSVPEADRAGVNIAAARGAATTLYLQRTLKEAQVVQADNEPAAFNLIKEGKAQVYAQNRYMLLGLADNLPGARVLEDRFSAAEMCIVLPKERPAALAYVSEFVEQSKKSGTVSRAIETAKLRGVRVAP